MVVLGADLQNQGTVVGEQPETVEDVYEPFLITQGMIARTPRGRVALAAAYDHVGITAPAKVQNGSLFE